MNLQRGLGGARQWRLRSLPLEASSPFALRHGADGASTTAFRAHAMRAHRKKVNKRVADAPLGFTKARVEYNTAELVVTSPKTELAVDLWTSMLHDCACVMMVIWSNCPG